MGNKANLSGDKPIAKAKTTQGTVSLLSKKHFDRPQLLGGKYSMD